MAVDRTSPSVRCPETLFRKFPARSRPITGCGPAPPRWRAAIMASKVCLDWGGAGRTVNAATSRPRSCRVSVIEHNAGSRRPAASARSFPNGCVFFQASLLVDQHVGQTFWTSRTSPHSHPADFEQRVVAAEVHAPSGSKAQAPSMPRAKPAVRSQFLTLDGRGRWRKPAKVRSDGTTRPTTFAATRVRREAEHMFRPVMGAGSLIQLAQQRPPSGPQQPGGPRPRPCSPKRAEPK